MQIFLKINKYLIGHHKVPGKLAITVILTVAKAFAFADFEIQRHSMKHYYYLALKCPLFPVRKSLIILEERQLLIIMITHSNFLFS